MTTQTADYTYILKELPINSGDGSDWAIECSPILNQLPFNKNESTLYIRMKSSTTKFEANKVCKLLTDYVANFTVISHD